MGEEEKHDELAWDALVDAANICCTNAAANCACAQHSPVQIKKDFVTLMGLAKRETHPRKNNFSDLELAAEIGKSLLEANRELELHLKRAQEYAEEQQSRAEFHSNQVDLLREDSEMKGRLCEQLENQLQEITEKSIHDENDNKLLRVQNRRLIETVDLMEKRLESARSEVEKMHNNSDIAPEMPLTVGNDDVEYANSLENDYDDILEAAPSGCDRCNGGAMHKKLQFSAEHVRHFESIVADLEIQHCSDSRQLQELECDFKELLCENELLQQKLREAQLEITEWKEISERSRQRNQLMEQFTRGAGEAKGLLSPDVHIKDMYYDRPYRRDRSMTKSKSCEFLCLSEKASIASHSWVKHLPALSTTGNGSVLDELNNQYGDLAQRYESLLSRFNNDERNSDISEQSESQTHSAVDSSGDCSPTPHNDAIDGTSKCTTAEYRIIFAEIFSKLKEFKE